MAFNIPPSVKIGEFSKKTEKFDDQLELTKQGGLVKINAIKVYFNEKYVLGMTLYYKLADGGYLKAAHNPQKDKKSIQKRVLEIGPDDYLKEISGHTTEKGITRITFSTYRGKEGTYGSDQGEPFIYKFEGHTFGAFAGGFKDHLKHLEITVCPVPVQFLDEFRPINVNVIIYNEEQKKPQQKQLDAPPNVNNQPVQPIKQQPQPFPQVNYVQPGAFQGMYVGPSMQGGFGQVFVPQTYPQQPNFGAPQYPAQSTSINSYPNYPVDSNKASFASDSSSNQQPLTKSKYPTFK